MPKTETTTFSQLLCWRCGHVWMPKNPRFPGKCPFCGTYTWWKKEKDKDSGPERKDWSKRDDPQRLPGFFMPDGSVNPEIIKKHNK